MVAVGLTGITTGAVLLGVGAARNKRFNAWRSGEREAVELAPIVAPSARGLTLGVAGRF